jgi:hypothetical protein
MDDDIGRDELPLVDESIPDDTTAAETGEAEGGGAAPAAPADPYTERFARIERDNAELRATLQRLAGQGAAAGTGGRPAALTKPRQQWTPEDWYEYSDWRMEHLAGRASEENEWRGKLSAAVVGEGNDYDAMTQRYLTPHLQANPEIAPLVQMLPAADRYMLSLMRHVYERSGGNLVAAVQAILNGVGARQAGARDVVRSITGGQRRTARGVFQGGGGAQGGRRGLTEDEVRNMPMDEFRKLVNRSTGN